MKKSNKGFSLVELIIVIAIMAILAGALAPALMKYINKTRLSSDIQAGQTVAKAIQAAMSNEQAFNDVDAVFSCEYSSADITTHDKGTSKAFLSECASVCGWDKAKHKAKKDMDGSPIVPGNFFVKVNVPDNSIQVYMQDSSTKDKYEVYPTPAPSLSAKTK